MTQKVRVEVEDSLDARSALLSLVASDDPVVHKLTLVRDGDKVNVVHRGLRLGRLPLRHPFTRLDSMPEVVDFHVEGNAERTLRPYLTIEVQVDAGVQR